MAQDENLSASEGSSSILHNTPATHTVRRSRKRKRKRGIDPAAVKPICYRIRGIPINTPKDELQSHLAKSAKKPEADLILTLALSHGKWLTATTGLLHATPKFTPSYEVDSNFFGITPLSGREDAVVDIIAIPGLGSHAIGGFKAKTGNNVWLRDFLPDDIPTARVLTYGYDTTITEQNSKYSITDLAKAFLDSYKTFREVTQTSRRSIIFIGHSLGGLLIKEALSMSCQGSKDSQNANFFKSSYGLVFFGVPNLGLRNEPLREVVAGQLNWQLIHDLQVDDEAEPTPYLRELAKKFIDCSEAQKPSFKITAYYEQRKTVPAKKMTDGTLSRAGEPCFMVTQQSASRIGIEDRDDERYPLDLDHSELVKFRSQFDDDYGRVLNRLKVMAEGAPKAVERRFVDNELSGDERRHWHDLNVPDYASFRSNVDKLARPAEGTLQWLVSDQPSEELAGTDSFRKEDLDAWRDSNESASLFVLGPPGQGKSVLSNFVIDNLINFVNKTRPNSKVVYYFCNIKNDQSSRNASNILRALIVQLCEDARLFRRLPNRFQDKTERRTFHNAHLDELWATFDDLVKSDIHTSIYCVIDGLDVYETEMEAFFARLKNSTAQKTYPLKLFCTSRPKHFPGFALSQTKHLRTPKKDLELFVDEKLQSFPEEFSDRTPDIKKALERYMGRTFLWISIVLQELQRQPFISDETVTTVIEDMPPGLDELYTNLVRAAFRKTKFNVAILLWITYAKEPLSLKQMETAITTTVYTDVSSWKNCCAKKPTLTNSAVQKALGTLVDVVGGKLYLIHQSLRDFLLSCDLWENNRKSELGTVCLTFLSFEEFSDATWYEDQWVVQKKEPFTEYALSFWYQHIENAGDVDIGMLERFLQGPNKHFWLNSVFLLHPSSRAGSTMLISQIAIELKIVWLTRMLLEGVFDEIYAFNTDCLARAAASSPAILQELLGHPKTNTIQITDDVVKAAANNWTDGEKVIELLLRERGDQVKITEEVVKAVARSYGGEAVMGVLLKERGSQVEITEEVVKAAAEKGGKELMELLLKERGNQVEITEEVVKAAAGNWGGKGVMELLLKERGNQVKITEEVVKAAAGNLRGKEVMELLLKECGNQIEITEEVVKIVAGSWGGDAVMELLVKERGDQIEITEEVVKAAARNRMGRGVMEFLIEHSNEVKMSEEVRKLLELRIEDDSASLWGW